MGLIISLLVNTLAVFVAAYIIPEIEVQTWVAAVVVAVFLGVLNTFVKPILTLLTLPLTLLTFGLFSFIISALFVWLAGIVIPGFVVNSFLWAVVFAVALSFISSFLSSLLKN